MGFEYYYIVIILVVLKLSIWACVLYFRAQRTRVARSERRFVVVDSHRANPNHLHSSVIPSAGGLRHNDRSAILNFEELPATSQGPPPYSEVMANPEGDDKPPPYSQVCPESLDTRTPIPPHFTASSQETNSTREATQ